MSFPGPAFDTELAELLKQPRFAQEKEYLTAEVIVKQRKLIEPLTSTQPILEDPELTHEEVTIRGPSGDIILSILRSKTSTKEENNPGLYLIHGGGMVIGNRFFLINHIFPTIKALGAVLVSVEYRLAPENPAPAAVEDCYAGLQWMFENSAQLGVDARKIIVAGGSAGGGLAAGVALLSRDRNGPPIFAQLLKYPMLDDRCTSISTRQFKDTGVWTGNDSIAGWDHYLPGIRGTDQVRIYDAPSRAQDLSNLPQAFIEVGACEPFRDEDVAYATKLWEHGVQAELHVWPGGWHAHDVFAPTTQLSQVSADASLKWLKRILAAPIEPAAPATL